MMLRIDNGVGSVRFSGSEASVLDMAVLSVSGRGTDVCVQLQQGLPKIKCCRVHGWCVHIQLISSSSNGSSNIRYVPTNQSRASGGQQVGGCPPLAREINICGCELLTVDISLRYQSQEDTHT